MAKNTIKHCTKLFFHKNTIKHCTKLFFHKNTIKHCTKLFFHKNTITHSTKLCFHKNNTKYCTKFCYYKNTIKHCSQFFFHKINKNMQRKLGVKHFCTSKGMTSLTPNSKLCNFITLWKLIKPQQNCVTPSKRGWYKWLVYIDSRYILYMLHVQTELKVARVVKLKLVFTD